MATGAWRLSNPHASNLPGCVCVCVCVCARAPLLSIVMCMLHLTPKSAEQVKHTTKTVQGDLAVDISVLENPEYWNAYCAKPDNEVEFVRVR